MTPTDPTARLRELAEKWRRFSFMKIGYVVAAGYESTREALAQCADELDTLVRTFSLEAASPEVCICAAIQMDNGIVLRGHRHDDCIQTAQKYGYEERITQAKQGFVTSRNRFVSREEGARLQQTAGIVSAHTGKFTDFLFSEDLYFNDNAKAASPASVEAAAPRDRRDVRWANYEVALQRAAAMILKLRGCAEDEIDDRIIASVVNHELRERRCMGELIEGGIVVCKCGHGHDGICGYQAPPAACGAASKEPTLRWSHDMMQEFVNEAQQRLTTGMTADAARLFEQAFALPSEASAAVKPQEK